MKLYFYNLLIGIDQFANVVLGGAPTRLAKGTDGQVLTLESGLPSWATASGWGDAIDWANPVSVTTAANLTIGKHHVCYGTTADYTVTLPAVSGNAGKLLSVEMSGTLTKLVTLDGNASETIDGATTAAAARVNLGAPGKYAAAIGDGTNTSFVVTHNLGTQDVAVSVAEASAPFNVVMTDIQLTSINTITVTFSTAPTSGQYKVTVIG